MTRVVPRAALVTAALVSSLVAALVPGQPAAASTGGAPVGLVASMSRDLTTAALARSVPATRQPPVRRLIVRTATGRVAGASIMAATRTLSGLPGATVVRRLASGSSLVSLSSPVTVAQAWSIARSLTARSDVVYAEPDLLMQPLGTPSPVVPADPSFGQQWDLWDSTSTASAGGWSSKAPAAWSRTRGRPQVVVAVLDTGITAHPELSGQTVPGYDFVSGDGPSGAAPYYTANDGNGRDPDPSDPGDWVSASEASSGFFADENCTPEASSWHGTHVAGTIAAKQGNGIGISGMAPGVRLQVLRVLGKCGGYTSDIVDAIRWAAGGTLPSGSGNPNGPNPTPASVINLSLGAPGPCDAETQGAISYAVGQGTTVVVAAGNDGASVVSTSASTGSNPADCAGVIDVVATDRDGVRASYSDFGHVAGSTVIAAPGGSDAGPGVDILSTVNAGTTSPTRPSYAWYAGTSMATPHVAAAAALLQSLRVGRTPYSPAQIASLLSGLTQPFRSGSGCSESTCGEGALDLARPLPTFVPLAPTDLVTQPAHQAVTMSWTPGDTGGNTDITYVVEQSTDGTTYVPATTSAGSSVQVTGLADDTDYWFRVTAVSASSGSSAAVATGPVRPELHTPPQWPASPVVTGGVERLTARWTAPSDGGDPITGYSVQYRLVGASTWTCAVPRTPVDPQCLVPAGTTSVTVGWPSVLAAGRYEVRVAAMNVNGLGVYSPSGQATVTALHQTMGVSGSVLRPLRDGYQDTVRITAASTVPASGSIRVLDARGRPVRTVTLPAGRSWAFVWTGLDQRGRRVPYGRYRIQVLLSGRTPTPVVVSTAPLLVSSSRASAPSVTVSTTSVYPVVDHYLDTVSIRATAVVPASFTIAVVGRHGTVWSRTLSRRLVARTVWNGTGPGRRLTAAGTYRLVVTARGAEGPAVSTSTPLVVSSRRVRPTSFHVVVGAATAQTMLLSGSISPYGTDGLSLDGPSTVIGVAVRLPSSVRTYSDVRLVACTDVDNAVAARARVAFVDDAAAIADGPWALPNKSGCYVAPAPAPSPSLWSRAVHFALANVASGRSPWVASAYEVTGTSYVLR